MIANEFFKLPDAEKTLLAMLIESGAKIEGMQHAQERM